MAARLYNEAQESDSRQTIKKRGVTREELEVT